MSLPITQFFCLLFQHKKLHGDQRLGRFSGPATRAGLVLRGYEQTLYVNYSTHSQSDRICGVFLRRPGWRCHFKINISFHDLTSKCIALLFSLHNSKLFDFSDIYHTGLLVTNASISITHLIIQSRTLD